MLPSGDVVCSWRLVVDRPPATRRDGAARTVTVDALDCSAWTTGLRRRAVALQVGDVVEVEGALRRRFWRGAGGASSRTEVEVSALRRVARAAGPSVGGARGAPGAKGPAPTSSER